MTEPTDMTTVEEVAQGRVLNKADCEEVSIPFEGITDNNLKYLAFVIDGNDNIDTELYYIDDVEVSLSPACSKPSLIRPVLLGADRVVVGWISRNATSWEVKVSNSPMSDLTLTANVYDATVNSKPHTITGLNPATRY